MNGRHQKMMKHTMIYNKFDVVKVISPFTGKVASKQRLALVILSSNYQINYTKWNLHKDNLLHRSFISIISGFLRRGVFIYLK